MKCAQIISEEKSLQKKVPYASLWDLHVCCQVHKARWLAIAQNLEYERIIFSVRRKSNTELDVTSFFDASWHCDKDEQVSYGYVFNVNGAVDAEEQKADNELRSAMQPIEYLGCVRSCNDAVYEIENVLETGVNALK
ncbi:hypothetical protein Tco_1212960 [Tanacetum coccineum]